MKARAHVYISGVVQGVFFRASARNKAKELGIIGWVRNLPDGRVEAVFEGGDAQVDAMVSWCQKGPSHSLVEDVDVVREGYKGEFGDFSVRY